MLAAWAIVCESCGTVFQAVRKDARFCSNACRQAAYRRRRVTSADEAVEVTRMGRKRRQSVSDDELPKIVVFECPKCKRRMEETEGRRMWCILCRVRMVAERGRRGEQGKD